MHGPRLEEKPLPKKMPWIALGIVLGAVLITRFAPAAETAQSVGATSQSEKNGVEKRFGAELSATLTESALEASDRERVSSLDLEIAPWASLGRRFRADAYVGISRELNGLQEAKVVDARLGLSRNPISLGKRFAYRPKATIYLPVDSDKREIRSFRGAVGLGNRLTYARGSFTGLYQLGVTKNIYAYTTAGDSGESNPSWSLSHSIKTIVSFGSIYLDLTGGLSQRWTFEATPSSSYEVSEEVGASLGAWNVGVGHTNGASLYQANGTDSNFSFANGNTSKFYLIAAYTF